jgi:hypothetical protein
MMGKILMAPYAVTSQNTDTKTLNREGGKAL